MFPWMGGKRRLAKHLLPLFPEHQCYVELFAGGAALFFMRDTPAKTEVLNDLNGELMNLYRVVQHHFDEFVKQFKFLCCSRQLFYQIKMTPLSILTDIQRAARFYYLQQHAFGGKCDGQTFGTATTAKAFDHNTIAQKLAASQQRLGGVFVENENWQDCLKRYDREHTFFYADPPYWQTAGYGNDFSWQEYEALAHAMKNTKGKMMISSNNHPDIRALFAGFWQQELSIQYTMCQNNRKEASELVICNYTP